MKKSYFCGFNGFRQFGSAHARKTATLTELPSDWSEEDLKYAFAWSFNARCRDRKVVISGFIGGTPNSEKVFELPDDIKSISTSDSLCLVLLVTGELYRINVNRAYMERLNFIRTERPLKRSALGEVKTDILPEAIEFAACGKYICIAITKSGSVYNVPSKIHDFPKHVKIRKLICGFEHAMVLTNNGDVYTWGNGIRGQLGHPELKIVEIPTLLEALAGVRIMLISAGGWHSAAISSFGDLYVWGSNINGQLGIALYSGDGDLALQRKNPSVYHLPQIAEFDSCCKKNSDEYSESSCNSVFVECGGRHTIVRNDCGKIYFAGWNEHNQSGFDAKSSYIDKFRQLKLPLEESKCDIYCGPWCSMFLLDSENDSKGSF